MSEYLLPHLLDNNMDRCSDRTVLSYPDQEITYYGLYTLSNKLAHYLRKRGVQRQDRVAFSVMRSPKLIISIMGILKADAIYVPIDPKSPIERQLMIMADCRPTAIILDAATAQNSLNSILPNIDPKTILVVLDSLLDLNDDIKQKVTTLDEVLACKDDVPIYDNIDSDIAYILYTSGSTGQPKGVMVSHLNVMNYIAWASEFFKVSSRDIILSTAPYHFDMSVFDTYLPMKVAAKLSLVPEGYLLFPTKLLNFIETEQATIWKGISSLFMFIARTGMLKARRIPSLQKLIFAGETLPTKYIIEWMKTFPDKEFYNGYGPTEATGMSMCYKVNVIPNDACRSIPIGKACGNSEAFILTDDDSLAQNGEIGELCIRGSGLARGYWGDPEKTAKAFVQNPLIKNRPDLIYKTGDLCRYKSDGNIEFWGRKDTQVKWMGYRIELGDIENALLSIHSIDNALVLLNDSGENESSELVAFVELNKKETSGKIFDELRSVLPVYMIPRKIIPINRLPRTDRGKIDRLRLLKLLRDGAQIYEHSDLL
jgi:amino acid adenylation domain-containing protein